MPRPYDELVHQSWVEPLAPAAEHIAAAGAFLRDEVAAGRGYLPAGDAVLRAFPQPFDEVRVLVVGGPRFEEGTAEALGVDRIFGKGTTPAEVASYLVHALTRPAQTKES